MSQQKAETTTIVRDGNTIIIAHPPVRKETNYWQLFTGLFKSETPQVEPVPEQPLPQITYQQPPVVIPVVSVQSQPTEASPVSEQPKSSQISEEWKEWTKVFSRQNINEYRRTLNKKISQLDGIDERLSNDIAKFKEENILTLGDIRTRSILMAFSSALMYKIISYNTTGLLRRTRNLGISFAFMGYWFAPELFNPFLRRPTFAHHVA